MKHDWYDPRPNDAHLLMAAPFRKCRNCGAEQTEWQDTWYMRIVRRYWRPKVGRCKPETSTR